jgi:hypothetical protein
MALIHNKYFQKSKHLFTDKHLVNTLRIPVIPPPDSEGSRHPVPIQSARVFRLIPPPLVGA